MKSQYLLAFLALLLCAPFAAQFQVAPYLFLGETASDVNYTTFAAGNGTATLVRVGGAETLLLLDDKMLTDKSQISSVLTEYYTKNFYPSQTDLSDLEKYALAFNKSRNYQTKYGPAEQTCLTGGTFLVYKPCDSIPTCMQTASLVCSITGSEGCIIDLLATHIYDYQKSIKKLNDAYAKFDASYRGLTPATLASSLTSMDEAFVLMKAGADEVKVSKLRFPDGGYTACRDCLGICPDSHFDFAAITSGREKVASIKDKAAYFMLLDTIVDKIAISTSERVKYRAGEETAILYKPKFDSAKASFAGMTAQVVEAKKLVADSDFVASANTFLAKEDELNQKMQTRDFAGFDATLSAYQSAGRALMLVVNNSTAPYQIALNSQDDAGDGIIKAQWRVNRLSKASIDSYNSLADRKNKLDAQFKPPMTSAQYTALSASYAGLTTDSKTYVAASASFQDSVFGVGNSLGRASVDGVMGVVASMTPVSFKTRLSVAKYVPVLVVGAIDVAMLAVGIMLFVGAFYYFHGFFRSKLAISGWALTLLGFVFVLLIGSVGMYSIIANSDKFVSFTEFMDTVKASPSAVVMMDETGVSSTASAAMKNCANQIEMQLRMMNKTVRKYYINGNLCNSIIPKASNGGNYTYEAKTGLVAADCLNAIPDVPVFDLRYSVENQPPVFTTIVTKSAIIKGNEGYYGKVPMCDPANVLN